MRRQRLSDRIMHRTLCESDAEDIVSQFPDPCFALMDRIIVSASTSLRSIFIDLNVLASSSVETRPTFVIYRVEDYLSSSCLPAAANFMAKWIAVADSFASRFLRIFSLMAAASEDAVRGAPASRSSIRSMNLRSSASLCLSSDLFGASGRWRCFRRLPGCPPPVDRVLLGAHGFTGAVNAFEISGAADVGTGCCCVHAGVDTGGGAAVRGDGVLGASTSATDTRLALS